MKTTHSFYIAGVQFHEMKNVISDLSKGDELDLVPEPWNKYDPNAVAIQACGTILGYVPKKFSSEVSAMLEVGKELTCVIAELKPQSKPWEQCKVDIGELDEDDDEECEEEPSEYNDEMNREGEAAYKEHEEF